MHHLYLGTLPPLAIPLPRAPRVFRALPLGVPRQAGVFVGVGTLGQVDSWMKDWSFVLR